MMRLQKVPCLLVIGWLLTVSTISAYAACSASEPDTLLQDMQRSYANIEDYRTEVTVRTFQPNGSVRTKQFLYTFKKPDHIRIDMISPHRGTILIYPDRNGKVQVRPGGWLSVFTLHLSVNNPLLKVAAGQHINQTSLGLLITNIGHSITDQRRSPLQITQNSNSIVISVTAENHFLPGVITRYRFTIAKGLCLPVKIAEATPVGVLKRTITFGNLHTTMKN